MDVLLLSDSGAEQDDVDEFDEAVNQALGWFEGRSRSEASKTAAVSSDADTKQRLFLDFRQLVITDRINVDALASKIREKLPPRVPVHLSLKCCRIEDDEGLETLKRFVSSLPYLTFISTTFLWFDYDDISDVVLSSRLLRELEVPLGHKPGISSVLEACGDQLTDLRFFSGGSFLNIDVLDEAMKALECSCKNLKSLALTSFRCDDDCLEFLLTTLVKWSNSRDKDLENLQISCDGGTLTPRALSFYTMLLLDLAASVKLKLRIGRIPTLFEHDSGEFFSALQQSKCLAKLELEDVGLTGSRADRLFSILESMSSSSVHITVVGIGIFANRSSFQRLLKSIRLMESVAGLSVIDCNGNSELDAEDCTEAVVNSVHSNNSLKHLTIRNGPDVLWCPLLDEMFERNNTIESAQKSIAFDTLANDIPLGLWPALLKRLQVEAGQFRGDPTYVVLQHLVSFDTFR